MEDMLYVLALIAALAAGALGLAPSSGGADDPDQPAAGGSATPAPAPSPSPVASGSPKPWRDITPGGPV